MLVLASQSPRRQSLLSQLGVKFLIHSADIDESVHINELPSNYVERLAIEKAKAIVDLPEYNIASVIGSDTCVVIDNCILGKPESKQHCIEMLMALSGQKHQVYTAVAIVTKKIVKVVTVVTHVEFKELTEFEIIAYWQSGEPQDKAGSYGIQGLGGQFVKSIDGSYSSVVGLPLVETAMLLDECKIQRQPFC